MAPYHTNDALVPALEDRNDIVDNALRYIGCMEQVSAKQHYVYQVVVPDLSYLFKLLKDSNPIVIVATLRRVSAYVSIGKEA
jgi:hypothetical protein